MLAGCRGRSSLHDGGDAGDAGPLDAGPLDGGPLDAGADGGPDAGPPLLVLQVLANRDSAQLVLAPMPGAADYRAYALPATVALDGGLESVSGTTIFCAGLVQHNLPATDAGVPLALLEINGLFDAGDVVVEALDRPCPFPGMIAADHHDIDVTNSEVEPAAQGVFSLFTEDEVRAAYGALIINGQGPATKAAQPAPPGDPRVLAAQTVHVVPTGNGAPLTATFFDDFSDESDQPVFIKSVPDAPPYHASQNGQLWQNSKWSIYSYGAHHDEDAAGDITDNMFHPYIARGGLQMVLADWQTDIFSSAIAYPRQLAHPSDTAYLHITYEVQSDASERRYWNLFVCGADQDGGTMDANGELLGDLIQTPFFFDPDGLDPVAQGWNCFQIFMRGGWSVALPPTNTFPETDVRVMVNLSDAGVRTNVVDVDPDQILQTYPGQTGIGPASWYRQESAGVLTAPMLDDQLRVGARTQYDLWLRRDRAVLFVNGQQRLCNDFPSAPLTMPEAAIGFGQVLYHSAAERQEFNVSYWLRTGQRYYLDDAPFVDSRTWDNLGFEENVPAIPSFDESACFVYAP